MKIGIIGAGNVGSALGRTFQAAGNELCFGLRSPKEPVEGIPALSMQEAVERSEILFLAVPFRAVEDAVRSLGDLSGKVLVDCTNPVGWQDGPVIAPTAAPSLGETVQQLAPSARVVKGFNTFGAEFHGSPVVAGQPVTVLLAGDDPESKARVASLAEGAGYAPVDAGPLRNARLLEHHALLWIHLAMKGGQGRRFTFQLVQDR